MSGAGARRATPGPCPPLRPLSQRTRLAPCPKRKAVTCVLSHGRQVRTADAVSQSLSVLLLGVCGSARARLQDSTLLGRGTGQRWEGGRHTSSRLQLVPGWWDATPKRAGLHRRLGKLAAAAAVGSRPVCPRKTWHQGQSRAWGTKGPGRGGPPPGGAAEQEGSTCPAALRLQVTRSPDAAAAAARPKGTDQGRRRGLAGGVPSRGTWATSRREPGHTRARRQVWASLGQSQ